MLLGQLRTFPQPAPSPAPHSPRHWDRRPWGSPPPRPGPAPPPGSRQAGTPGATSKQRPSCPAPSAGPASSVGPAPAWLPPGLEAWGNQQVAAIPPRPLPRPRPPPGPKRAAAEGRGAARARPAPPCACAVLARSLAGEDGWGRAGRHHGRRLLRERGRVGRRGGRRPGEGGKGRPQRGLLASAPAAPALRSPCGSSTACPPPPPFPGRWARPSRRCPLRVTHAASRPPFPHSQTSRGGGRAAALRGGHGAAAVPGASVSPAAGS